jgi:outer membrane protein assembly factor BamB
MPRALAWIIAAVAVLVVALGGLAVSIALLSPNETKGELDTELTDVVVVPAPEPKPRPRPKPAPAPTSDELCWPNFGGDPQRTLSRPNVTLGLPARRLLWTRALGDYMEYPPSYCEGVLYVNTFNGMTLAIDASTGKVIWRRQGNTHASTPAIDGPRVIVSSHDGTVSALERRSGDQLWRVTTAGKVESSPVVVDGLAYFGSTDGRLFAVQSDTGQVRWAYDTGGRINSSPSVYGSRVCISTYAGSIFCLNRRSGERIWSTYVQRDALRYESFYASPSTDGARVYCVARSGKVVALDARNGRLLWTSRVGGYGYTTPAVANGRVFVGGFDGKLRALRSSTGAELWQVDTPGRILGAPFVAGNHVFFSILEQKTYGVRVADGQVVWRVPMGKYSPGIVTERTYYFSLNGRLIAYRGRKTSHP